VGPRNNCPRSELSWQAEGSGTSAMQKCEFEGETGPVRGGAFSFGFGNDPPLSELSC
jgi:hypothetical protein